ncbi:MAG: universal stress protein [Planctomycetes bacterium]|nr:universal stress protein [Planctomycetota bacterium]
MTGAHFRDIVVPYDGSEMSELAAPYAAEFAKRWVGHLTLVRAMPEPAMVTDIPRSILESVIVQARKELAAAAARAGGEVVVKTMLREGLPVDVILREVRGRDMIAMTTHGRSGLSRMVLGSVTEKVIRVSPVPVLVIRPRRGTLKSAATAAGRMFRDVVVPLDGSDLAREAVAPLAAGLAEDTRLHLLTVVRSGATSKESEAAADWLAARAATLESRGLVALTRVVHHDSPAEGIGAYAEHNDCGLVVMSTHGAGGLREWMLGSVTDQMIRRGPVPVLVVPPHGARKSAKK